MIPPRTYWKFTYFDPKEGKLFDMGFKTSPEEAERVAQNLKKSLGKSAVVYKTSQSDPVAPEEWSEAVLVYPPEV